MNAFQRNEEDEEAPRDSLMRSIFFPAEEEGITLLFRSEASSLVLYFSAKGAVSLDLQPVIYAVNVISVVALELPELLAHREVAHADCARFPRVEEGEGVSEGVGGNEYQALLNDGEDASFELA